MSRTLVAPELPTEATSYMAAIDLSMTAAVEGDAAGAGAYTRAWRALVRVVVAADAPGAAPALAEILDHLAIEAPLSPWLTAFGPGAGAAQLLRARVRTAIGLGSPPEPDAGVPPWLDLERLDFPRFAGQVWRELQRGEGEMARLADSWQLSQTDLARMFGVTRQAVAQWLEDGVPPGRQPKLLTIVRLADLLERNLVSDRIPAVVRSPAEALGGGTLLEMIAADRQDEAQEAVARSFDWAAGV